MNGLKRCMYISAKRFANKFFKSPNKYKILSPNKQKNTIAQQIQNTIAQQIQIQNTIPQQIQIQNTIPPTNTNTKYYPPQQIQIILILNTDSLGSNLLMLFPLPSKLLLQTLFRLSTVPPSKLLLIHTLIHFIPPQPQPPQPPQPPIPIPIPIHTFLSTAYIFNFITNVYYYENSKPNLFLTYPSSTQRVMQTLHLLYFPLRK